MTTPGSLTAGGQSEAAPREVGVQGVEGTRNRSGKGEGGDTEGNGESIWGEGSAGETRHQPRGRRELGTRNRPGRNG